MEDHGKGQNIDKGGWRVAQSIAMELDMALTSVYDYFEISGLAEDVAAMVQSCPKDWVQEGFRYIGSGKRMISLMEMMAQLSGTLLERDYRAATLSMRALNLESAFAELERQSKPFELPVKGETLREQFVNRMVDFKVRLYQSVGFEVTQTGRQALIARAEAERVVSIFRDGELHDEFWLWMDRFYYERYRDWRSGKISELEALQNQTTAVLGACSPRQAPPALDWLSPQNPLQSYSELKKRCCCRSPGSRFLGGAFWPV